MALSHAFQHSREFAVFIDWNACPSNILPSIGWTLPQGSEWKADNTWQIQTVWQVHSDMINLACILFVHLDKTKESQLSNDLV